MFIPASSSLCVHLPLLASPLIFPPSATGLPLPLLLLLFQEGGLTSLADAPCSQAAATVLLALPLLPVCSRELPGQPEAAGPFMSPSRNLASAGHPVASRSLKDRCSRPTWAPHPCPCALPSRLWIHLGKSQFHSSLFLITSLLVQSHTHGHSFTESAISGAGIR